VEDVIDVKLFRAGVPEVELFILANPPSLLPFEEAKSGFPSLFRSAVRIFVEEFVA
jgi:hypothetical protein